MLVHRTKLLTWAAILLFVLCSCAGSTESLGLFGESRLESVLGQDGVSPIPFNDSLTMWTFGDTILGKWKGEVSASATFSERADANAMISNSLAFTPAITGENIRSLHFTFHRENGRVAQFLKLKPGERPERDRLWAVDGLRTGDRVYVYYLRIRITDPGKPFGFRMDGVGLARWSVPIAWSPGKPVEFIRLPDVFPGTSPAFGACVIERMGTVYTVGQFVDGSGVSRVKIARAPIDGIEDRRAYTFLAGDGSWTGIMEKAHGFLEGVAGECSLSYNESTGGYILLYCRIGTGEIVMVTFGDFAELHTARGQTVYAPPALPSDAGDRHAWYYSGKEIFSEGRDLYAIYMHPIEYQPQLIKIRLPHPR